MTNSVSYAALFHLGDEGPELAMVADFATNNFKACHTKKIRVQLTRIKLWLFQKNKSIITNNFEQYISFSHIINENQANKRHLRNSSK